MKKSYQYENYKYTIQKKLYYSRYLFNLQSKENFSFSIKKKVVVSPDSTDGAWLKINHQKFLDGLQYEKEPRFISDINYHLLKRFTIHHFGTWK